MTNFSEVCCKQFFFEVLSPEFFTRKIGICAHNKQQNYCYCKQSWFEPMLACDNTDSTIEGFHYACVQITRAPHGSSFCPNCVSKKNTKWKWSCEKSVTFHNYAEKELFWGFSEKLQKKVSLYIFVKFETNAFQDLANIYMFKFNKRKARTSCGTCLKLTKNTPEQCYGGRWYLYC